MNTISRVLALSFFGLLAGSAAYAAEKPAAVTTLSCMASDGSAALKETVYAYNFDTGLNDTRYFSAYVSGADFAKLALAEYFVSTYSYCFFANMSGMEPQSVTITDVTSSGVGVDVDAGDLSEDTIAQKYTEVIFSYTFLSILNAQVKEQPKGTPEQEKQALESFKARGLAIPKP